MYARQPEAGVAGPGLERVAGQALDLRADVDHRSRLVEVGQVGDGGHLLDQRAPAALGRAHRLVGVLSVGDVAQVAGEQRPLARHPRDRQLNRELAAVSAQRGHLDPAAEDRRLARSERGERPAVRLAVLHRDDQAGQLLAQRLHSLIAERHLRGRVPLDDPAVAVDHDHAVEGGIDHRRLYGLALSQRGFRELPVRDVLDHPGHASRVAVLVALDAPVHVHQPLLAGDDRTGLVLEALAMLGRIKDVLDHARPVVGVHDVKPGVDSLVGPGIQSTASP